jgi:hypothetical protein
VLAKQMEKKFFEVLYEKMSDSSERYLSHRELMTENELEEVDF